MYLNTFRYTFSNNLLLEVEKEIPFNIIQFNIITLFTRWIHNKSCYVDF